MDQKLYDEIVNKIQERDPIAADFLPKLKRLERVEEPKEGK